MANELKNRDTLILDAAIELALAHGYQNITREQVAYRAGVAVGTVNNAYATMIGLKRAVLQAAVDRSIVEIVAQGRADQSPITRDIPDDLKSAVVSHLMG